MNSDSVWPAPKLSPGAENEPGSLGGLLRSGRTLRTPSFQERYARGVLEGIESYLRELAVGR